MRSTPYHLLATMAAAIALGACSDPGSPLQRFTLTDAFATVPTGFDATSNSFGATSSTGAGMWLPQRGKGPGHGLGMMGGGLGLEFFGGGPGFGGPGHGRGPFGDPGETGNCAFASGVVTCTDTRGSLTITKLIEYKTAAGVAQQAKDETTNSMRVRTEVSGTVTRHDSATSVLQHSSDRTVTGLATGSTARTVNGTSKGTESTTGTVSDGPFSATRTVSDTTQGVVVPVSTSGPTYPTAGTVIRNLKATRTISGTTNTTTRREVITYDGSATAKITITQDGATKNCTIPLPHGRLSCS